MKKVACAGCLRPPAAAAGGVRGNSPRRAERILQQLPPQGLEHGNLAGARRPLGRAGAGKSSEAALRGKRGEMYAEAFQLCNVEPCHNSPVADDSDLSLYDTAIVQLLHKEYGVANFTIDADAQDVGMEDSQRKILRIDGASTNVTFS